MGRRRAGPRAGAPRRCRPRGAAGRAQQAGRRGLGISVDVSDGTAVDAAAEQVEQVEHALGPIDLGVNNAFTGSIAFFDDVEPREFECITAVTYFGFVNGTRAALRRMGARGTGTIVQVGSALASETSRCRSAYCGADAIKGFTRLGAAPRDRAPPHAGPADLPARGRRPRRRTCRGAPAALDVGRPADGAHHPRNRLAPSLLDAFLARTNVNGQQSPDHDPPGPRSNTWEPAYGAEVAAHGSFDAQAHAPALSSG
jgi:hypothetical protein